MSIGIWKACKCGGNIKEVESINSGGILTVKGICEDCKKNIKDVYNIKYVKREYYKK